MAIAEPANTTSPATAPSDESPDRAGRTAFEAIYFGQGPEADKLFDSDLFDDATKQALVSNNSSPAAAGFLHAVEDSIASTDGSAFEQFNTDVRSGDPYKVRSATEKMADKARDAANMVGGGGVRDVTGPDGQLCGVTVLVGAAFVIALAAFAAEAAVIFSSVVAGSQGVVGDVAAWVHTSFWSATNATDQLAADQKLATLTASMRA